MATRNFSSLALAFALGAGGAGSATALAQPAGGSVRQVVTRTHGSMGTVIAINAYTDDPSRAERAFDAAFREFDRVDALMTTWTETSDISRINAAAGNGKPISVSPEVTSILAVALETSKGSDGAFDVTVGAFSGVWKFDE